MVRLQGGTTCDRAARYSPTRVADREKRVSASGATDGAADEGRSAVRERMVLAVRVATSSASGVRRSRHGRDT